MTFSKLLITVIIIFMILLIYFTYSPRELVEILNDNLHQIRVFGESNFITLNIFDFRSFISLNLSMSIISSGGFLPVNSLDTLLNTQTKIISRPHT